MSEKIKEINLLIQQGEFKKSISLIDDILNKGTQDYRLFTMKGLALFSLGKYQNSIEYFTKSIEVKKDIFLIYNYRALANIVLAKNNFAIIDLKKTIELKPDYFEAYNTLGSVLLNNGKILEAIDSYVKCLNIKSNHKLALENLIVALTSENKVNYDNKIILANNEICKLKFEYSSTKFIDDKIISSTFNKSNIIIDVSSPEGTKNLIQKLENNKVPLIIGTTGIDDISSIKSYSRSCPIALISNFTEGIPIIMDILRKYNISNSSYSIIESHHINKKDSPSGTALSLKNSINTNNKIEVQSIREGDIVYVEKGGEIIPKVVKVDLKARDLFASATIFIKKCPSIFIESLFKRLM